MHLAGMTGIVEKMAESKASPQGGRDEADFSPDCPDGNVDVGRGLEIGKRERFDMKTAETLLPSQDSGLQAGEAADSTIAGAQRIGAEEDLWHRLSHACPSPRDSHPFKAAAGLY